MRLLHRFSRRPLAVLAVALVVILTFVAVMVVVASGEEDPSEDGMDVKLEPTTSSPTASPPSDRADRPGEVPGAPSSTSGPARSSFDDPDRPVSSDDPPPSPRPIRSPPADGIDSFEECAAAGYPIAESYPEQCFTPDGRSFTRVIS